MVFEVLVTFKEIVPVEEGDEELFETLAVFEAVFVEEEEKEADEPPELPPELPPEDEDDVVNEVVVELQLFERSQYSISRS